MSCSLLRGDPVSGNCAAGGKHEINFMSMVVLISRWQLEFGEGYAAVTHLQVDFSLLLRKQRSVRLQQLFTVPDATGWGVTTAAGEVDSQTDR